MNSYKILNKTVSFQSYLIENILDLGVQYRLIKITKHQNKANLIAETLFLVQEQPNQEMKSISLTWFLVQQQTLATKYIQIEQPSKAPPSHFSQKHTNVCR